jgi:phosphoribosyl 1,2-cyclic phosphodiesterase
MLIETIASGSSGNCYVVEHQGERLLIECGISLRKIRRALNFNLSNIVGCLISHEHQDHCRSAPEIIGTTSIPVRGPDTIKSEKWVSGYEAITPEFYFSLGGFMIRALENDHDAPCFSYEIRKGANLLMYVTDTAAPPYIAPNTVTHLMIEANHSFRLLKESDIHPDVAQRIWDTHLDIDMAVLFAKRHKRTLREAHLLHLSDAHSDEEVFKRKMTEAVGVPVYVASKETL